MRTALVIGWTALALPAVAQQQFTPSPLPNALPSTPGPPAPAERALEQVPILDPTARTLQSQVRELDTLKELLFTKDEAIKELLIALTSSSKEDRERIRERVMDAERLARADIERNLALIEQMFATQDQKLAVLDQKLEGVNFRLEDGVRQLQQFSGQSEGNLEKALVASKAIVDEQNKSSAAAIAKSEANIFEQLKQGSALSNNSIAAIVQQLNDLKARVDRSESRIEGATAQGLSVQGFILLGFTALAAVLGVAGFMRAKPEPRPVYVNGPAPAGAQPAFHSST